MTQRIDRQMDMRKIGLVSTARVLVHMRQPLPRIVVIVYLCKLFGHSPVHSCILIRVMFIWFLLWLIDHLKWVWLWHIHPCHSRHVGVHKCIVVIERNHLHSCTVMWKTLSLNHHNTFVCTNMATATRTYPEMQQKYTDTASGLYSEAAPYWLCHFTH